MLNPFLTGSTVYGMPRFDSDVDIVIFAPREFTASLLELTEADGFLSSDSGVEASSVRIGEVNLIIAHTKNAFQAWHVATERCKKEVVKLRRALTREEAIEIHRQTRDEFGIDR